MFILKICTMKYSSPVKSVFCMYILAKININHVTVNFFNTTFLFLTTNVVKY